MPTHQLLLRGPPTGRLAIPQASMCTASGGGHSAGGSAAGPGDGRGNQTGRVVRFYRRPHRSAVLTGWWRWRIQQVDHTPWHRSLGTRVRFGFVGLYNGWSRLHGLCGVCAQVEAPLFEEPKSRQYVHTLVARVALSHPLYNTSVLKMLELHADPKVLALLINFVLCLEVECFCRSLFVSVLVCVCLCISVCVRVFVCVFGWSCY